MKRNLFFCFFLLLPCLVFCQSNRPNVVLIIADDLGRNDLACYGNRYIETPNIDRIAASSIRFTNAYAAAPVCSPTRTSILTGQYPSRVGVTNFIDGKKQDPASPVLSAPYINYLPYAVLTLPEFLKTAGYQTALIGKWHLGENTHPDKCYPGNNGFDVVKHFDYGLIPEKESYVWIKGTDSAGSRFRLPELTDMITNDAVAYLDTARTSPFLLMITHYNPHLPLQPKPALADKYRSKPNPYGKELNPLYAAMVEELDINVGKVWDHLEAKGLLKNTIFIFLSDNGGVAVPEAGESQPTTSAPLRSGKGTLYEGGIKIPFILYHPASRANKNSTAQITTTDLLPTILNLCNVPLPNTTLDGESFSPLIRGEKWNRNHQLFWHYPHFSNQGGRPTAALRDKNYKLIQSLEDGSLSLYDLEKDQGESINIASKNPAIVGKMFSKLQWWQQQTKAVFPIPKDK